MAIMWPAGAREKMVATIEELPFLSRQVVQLANCSSRTQPAVPKGARLGFATKIERLKVY